MYSIYRFISEDCATNAQQFSKESGIAQSTIATYKQRNTRVEELPLKLVCALSNKAKINLDKTVKKLFQYEKEQNERSE